MSTEHQQYSTANQSAAIALYAAAHNIGIVRSFTDEGKSGTTIKRRTGLQELLRTVESGTAEFDLILVYDVSRWGRFPDADEAAHYEFLCKKAGIGVRYCAEQFENDNSTTSNLLKALKRTMAGEYSRELSAKVFAGQCRLAALGWWHGGPAPFGFVRQLVDKDGRRKQILKPGECKSIATDRVTLRRGSRNAVATIKLVFDLFTQAGKNRKEIQDHLNGLGMLFHGRPWNHRALGYVLKNPVYKGTNVFGRHEWKGTRKHRTNPSEKWIVCDGAFPAIIPKEQFALAQRIIERCAKRFEQQELLYGLQRIWKQQGTLNQSLIEADKSLPSTHVFAKRFGGLRNAYELVGFPLKRDFSFVSLRKVGKEIINKLADEICYRVRSMGGMAVNQGPLSPRQPASATLLINEGISILMVISSGRTWRYRRTVWSLHIERLATRDILIIVRLRPDHRSILDYYVIPALSQLHWKFLVREKNNSAFLDLYRTETLQPFIESLRRWSVEGSA